MERRTAMEQKNESLLGQWDDTKRWKQEIYSMWQEIFGDPEPFAQYYYEKMYEKNRIYTMWTKTPYEEKGDGLQAQQVKENHLCGMIHLNPYKTKISDERKEIDYIVGVAVDEKMRRRGIMRKMLKEVMEAMRKQKKPFTFLMPAKEAYYTPFDFRFVLDRYLYTAKELSQDPDKGEQNSSYEFLPYDKEHHEKKLIDFCDDYWKQFDIAPIRDGNYFEQMVAELEAEKGQILLLKKKEEIVGYLTYVLEEDILIVRELITKEEARDVLRAFQAWKGANRLKAYLDWFHKMSKEEVEIVPTIMIRILDVKEMLAHFRADQEVDLTFRLHDPLLEENNGVYHWRVNGATSLVEERVESEKVDFEISISELTELLFGYPKYAVENKKREYFKAIRPLSRIYISEIV